MTKKVEPAGWLYFKDEAAISPYQLFTEYKADMGLSSNDTMILTKSEDDEYGYTHNRYQQYYQSLKVEGAEYTEHIQSCIVKYAHGKLLEHDIIRNVTPTISESTALSSALTKLGAEVYSWQDPAWEARYQEILEDPMASSFPEGELLLAYITQTGVVSENYALAWRFEILALDPVGLYEVYVDAETGVILKIASLAKHNGPAELLFGYGVQTIDTHFHNGLFGGYHYLRALEDGRNIHTKKGDLFEGQAWSHPFFADLDDVKDNDDNWGTSTSAHTTAHWVVSQAWNYFKQEHARNGYKNDGKEVKVVSNPVDGVGSTAWLPWPLENHDIIEFGRLGGVNQCAIDIGGHEFTHGLIHYTSRLGAFNQPGALAESFCDIFGFMIERFSFPTNFDWIFGEDALTGDFAGFQRSLEDPGSIIQPELPDRDALGLPNVFLGDRWYNGQEDNGGIHINCGPQNRWFNLLAVGGTESDIDVDGIGIDNAARITYYSLLNNLQNQSQYPDAREGAVEAARILFGECSFELAQTMNAWAAVGLGDVFEETCLDVEGEKLFFCPEDGYPVVFTAIAPEGATITWEIPTGWGWDYTIGGLGNSKLTLNNIFPEPGEQSYLVKATSSLGGSDSQVFYIFCEGGGCEPKSGGSKPGIKKTGGKTPINSDVAVFPNPAKNRLSVLWDYDEVATVEVVNLTGHVLMKVVPESGLLELSISHLPPGMYYLRVNGIFGAQAVPFVKQ